MKRIAGISSLLGMFLFTMPAKGRKQTEAITILPKITTMESYALKASLRAMKELAQSTMAPSRAKTGRRTFLFIVIPWITRHEASSGGTQTYHEPVRWRNTNLRLQ